MKRIITYDIKNQNDYTKLYNFIDQYHGKKITESTYLIDSQLTQSQFKAELKKVIASNLS